MKYEGLLEEFIYINTEWNPGQSTVSSLIIIQPRCRWKPRNNFLSNIEYDPKPHTWEP